MILDSSEEIAALSSLLIVIKRSEFTRTIIADDLKW
jgi:hypothetical protein